eukprot:s129_g22.t1
MTAARGGGGGGNLFLPPPPPPPPPGSPRASSSPAADRSRHCRTSSASSRSQWALPDVNRDCQIPVGTAGPQLRAADRSGQRRTSTASSRSQWATPDLNREFQIAVGNAGPQPRVPDPSEQRQTSTASSRSQWATPDLNHELQIPVGNAGPQPPDRMSLPARSHATSFGHSFGSLPSLFRPPNSANFIFHGKGNPMVAVGICPRCFVLWIYILGHDHGQVHLVSAERPAIRALGALQVEEAEREENLPQDPFTELPYHGVGHEHQAPCNRTVEQHAAWAVLHAWGLSSYVHFQGDHCDWFGMMCQEGCVVAIQISNREVRGTLPAALANFVHLSTLNLASTKISGKLKIIASMKNLQQLDLSGTEVAGDIQALQEVQKLQHINLHSTRVAGDIQVFQALVQLKSLNLGNTQVVGDIQAFQATQSLDSLRLVATQVSGDISAFKATKDLTVLNLDLTHIFGDVQVFQATKSLIELSLKSTDVTGAVVSPQNKLHKHPTAKDLQVIQDIKVFENTNSLEYFDLASTKVTGDIQVLNATGQLKVVHLPNTRVHGDIAVFSSTDISELTSLSMGNSAVFGNISALKSAEKLSEVVFASTRVGGDIRVFENKAGLQGVICSSTQVTGDHLMFLDLSFTPVTGDVKVFVGNQQLQILKLASAPVFGDIGVLGTSEQNGFSVLDLSFTQVVGNIWVFQNAWQLKELYLGGTKVTGSIEGIVSWSQAQVVDLSDTLVTGRLTKRWRGCCRLLRILKLSGSRVQFVPNGDDLVDLMNLQQLKNPNLALLPALTTLEVSGCRLNCPVQDLILPLGACEHVGTIKAVKSGLMGELPNLDPMPPTIVETGIFLAYRSSLASSLEFTDLSGNNLSYIAAVPGASQTLVLAGNKRPLRFAKDALSKALKHGVFVDLRGTRLHNETSQEAQILLRENVMRNTSQRIYSRPERGYSCYDLDRNSTTLQVSPPDFLPDEWCACMAGWHGMGTRCTKCPENTFSEELNADTCKECPVNTTTDKDGSTSMWDCKCEAGELHALNGSHLCGCPEGFASSGVSCVNCAGLHLNCSDRFSDVASADPDTGFARLVLKAEEAYECFPPAKLRCPGRNGSGLGCAPGYQGSLCMGCSEGHFSAGRSCVECSGEGLPSWLIKTGLALLLFFFFLIATFIIAHTWLNYMQTCIFPPGVLGSLQQQNTECLCAFATDTNVCDNSNSHVAFPIDDSD